MGRFTILLQDGSQTILAVVKDVKGRRRKLITAAVILVIALAAGGYGIFRYMTAQAEQRVVDSYSTLSACLMGKPLAQGERPSLHFRAMQLSAMSRADLLRSESKKRSQEPWPDRCAVSAHALREALQDAGHAEAGKEDLAHWAEQLAAQLKKKTAYADDLSEVLDKTWEQADKAGLKPGKVGDGQAPPEPAKALSLGSLPATTRITAKALDLKSLRPAVHPSTSVRFVVENKDVEHSPFLCSLRDSDQSVQCASLPSAVAKATHAGFFLLGTADEAAAPLVFGGDRGADGAFRTDSGEQVAEAAAFGGHVAADGFTTVLGWNKPKTGLQLTRISDDKPRALPVSTATFRLRTDTFEQNATLLWNQLVLRGKNTFDETWLAAAPVQAGLTMLGEVQNVGRLDEPEKEPPPSKAWPELAGCRSTEAIVLRARYAGQEYLSFAKDGRWSKPVKLPDRGGVLGCRKTEATITRIDPGAADTPLDTTITHHQCSPASCQTQRLAIKKLVAGALGLAPSAVLAAGGLDGKLLVVWGAGPRGGLRMRLAPASRIAQATDVIVFDDLVKDGQVQATSSLFDIRLIASERFALLLLSTSAGLHALRITPDGAFAPLEVSWAK